jgi:protein TonB
MKASSDIYTWPMALVSGSIITLALFFTLPALRFRQTSPEPPVIEIDFMQWREPAPAPKTKTPPAPKPVPVKPKPRPRVTVPPTPKTKPKPQPTPLAPEPVIPEKTAPDDPPVETPPKEAPPPAPQPPLHENTAKHSEEILPTPTPIFQLTSLPRFAHKVEPQYPPSMRALGREARVKVEALIDPRGRVRKVTILKSGGEAFDQAAKSAIMASSFIPGNVQGKSVSVLMRIPIVFRLK